MLDFISNIAKAPGKILDAVDKVPFANTLLDQIPIVNNIKNGLETFDDNIAPLVEKTTTTIEGFREDPTAAIANLASEVSDLSLEEIDNLDASQLDAIFEDAGVSPDMVNQLVEDTVGYSDPSSSSTYDPSDPNFGVSPSDFFGNNGSGNNVVDPFNTSSTDSTGSTDSTDSTDSTGSTGFDLGSFTPPDSDRTGPDYNQMATDAQTAAEAAAGYGDFITDLQTWSDDKTTQNQMDSTAGINGNKMKRDVHTAAWESASASIASTAQKAARGYQG